MPTDEDLKPARGVVIGSIVSTVVWLFIAFAVIVWCLL